MWLLKCFFLKISSQQFLLNLFPWLVSLLFLWQQLSVKSPPSCLFDARLCLIPLALPFMPVLVREPPCLAALVTNRQKAAPWSITFRQPMVAEHVNHFTGRGEVTFWREKGCKPSVENVWAGTRSECHIEPSREVIMCRQNSDCSEANNKEGCWWTSAPTLSSPTFWFTMSMVPHFKAGFSCKLINICLTTRCCKSW